MKLQLNLGNHVWILQSLFRRRRNTEFVEGYTNRCKDGRYVIFLDYDRLELNWIKEELRHLQGMFELGDFHLFQSSEDSYHAVCLDKVVISEFLSILKNSSVDVNYVDVPLHFGKKIWTLRLTDKDKLPVKYLGKLTGRFSELNQSSPHAHILNKLFNINIKLKYPDNQEDLILARYPI